MKLKVGKGYSVWSSPFFQNIDKFIKAAKVLTLLKSNSTSISISNRDVAHETLSTSRFEIEMEVEFEV